MKKKNIITAALVCCGIAAIGYLVKKVYDLNDELKTLNFSDLEDDYFEY